MAFVACSLTRARWTRSRDSTMRRRMKRPTRKRLMQMCLPQPGRLLPVWSSLSDEQCREAVVLMSEMLRQYVEQTRAERGVGHE